MGINEKLLQKYAELIVRTGANVRRGQVVQLVISVELHAFAAMLMEACYQAGALTLTTPSRPSSVPPSCFTSAARWQQPVKATTSTLRSARVHRSSTSSGDVSTPSGPWSSPKAVLTCN